MVLDRSVRPGDKTTVEADGEELKFEVESGVAQIDEQEVAPEPEPAATTRS